MKRYVIGIDIGGTNTDGVLVDDANNIVYACKTRTTDPVEDGFSAVLKKIFNETDISAEQVTGVFVGSTHAINAILQCKGLFKVGVLRLAGPAGKIIPPCFGWPQDLKDAIYASSSTVAGGYRCDGLEINALDKEQVCQSIEDLLKKGAESFAVIGVYAPLKNDQELKVAKWIDDIAGKDFPVCLSSEVGGPGFIERENATILNASLKKTMKTGFENISAIAKKFDLHCPMYITQNNGTIMDLKDAIEFPVLTISSGPTNSFVGASKLSGKQDLIVADIGGTSTDVGIVLNGFPRRSVESTNIGGIPINFPMPDVISIAIGGGSYITVSLDGTVVIGPESAGRKIEDEAQSFGGEHLTLTDVAIVKGMVDIPNTDASKVKAEDEISTEAIAYVEKKLLKLKKKIAGKKKELPFVLVGGGSLLLKKSDIAKVCIIPEHADVANAYGAALAEISGSVDTVVSLDDRKKMLDELTKKATEVAIKKGADEKTTRVVNCEILPFNYIPGNLARVKITVSGKRK